MQINVKNRATVKKKKKKKHRVMAKSVRMTKNITLEKVPLTRTSPTKLKSSVRNVKQRRTYEAKQRESYSTTKKTMPSTVPTDQRLSQDNTQQVEKRGSTLGSLSNGMSQLQTLSKSLPWIKRNELDVRSCHEPKQFEHESTLFVCFFQKRKKCSVNYRQYFIWLVNNFKLV
jgi:hypothetical protein